MTYCATNQIFKLISRLNLLIKYSLREIDDVDHELLLIPMDFNLCKSLSTFCDANICKQNIFIGGNILILLPGVDKPEDFLTHLAEILCQQRINRVDQGTRWRL